MRDPKSAILVKQSPFFCHGMQAQTLARESSTLWPITGEDALRLIDPRCRGNEQVAASEAGPIQRLPAAPLTARSVRAVAPRAQAHLPYGGLRR